MQYTDNEAALIGGLISNYFLRPAVSAALKDSCAGASAYGPGFRCRSQADPKGSDVPDADLSAVQRGPARPDGCQPEDNGAA